MLDRLAPQAWAVVAVGTCATYGGVHAMAGNPNRVAEVAPTLPMRRAAAAQEMPSGIIQVDQLENLQARMTQEPLLTRTFRINYVPVQCKGAFRQVYPGFIQLSGFMTMNLERHMDAHADLFRHLVAGDCDSVDQHQRSSVGREVGWELVAGREGLAEGSMLDLGRFRSDVPLVRIPAVSRPRTRRAGSAIRALPRPPADRQGPGPRAPPGSPCGTAHRQAGCRFRRRP